MGTILKKSFAKEEEDLLRSIGFLQPNQTLHRFLSQPYAKIRDRVFDFKNECDDFSNSLLNAPGFVIFLIRIVPFMLLSSLIYQKQNRYKREEVKLNILWIRKEIGKYLVKECAPFILNFLKWDFNRRTWAAHSQIHKIKFLEQVVNEIDQEFKGEKISMIKKYSGLVVEFVIDFYEDALQNFMDFDTYNINRAASFKTLSQLKVFAKSYEELIDENLEKSFIKKYLFLVKDHIEGLLTSTSEYDYLIRAFIHAQDDYKKFINAILSSFTKYQGSYIDEIQTCLEKKEIDRVVEILRGIYATLPYQLIANASEAHIHSIFHVIFKLIGCNITSEVPTNLGRIDAVIEFSDVIYIIEIKTSHGSNAIAQINQKKYFEAYLLKDKEIILMGLHFCNLSRNLKPEYQIERLHHN